MSYHNLLMLFCAVVAIKIKLGYCTLAKFVTLLKFTTVHMYSYFLFHSIFFFLSKSLILAFGYGTDCTHFIHSLVSSVFKKNNK